MTNLDERSIHLRRLVVRALAGGGRGHVGSALSLIEILRVLYDGHLRFDAADPAWPGRDRMILSKGHGCLAQYVMLADKGYFPVAELDDFCGFESFLGGHPERGRVPGVETSTGALGHGLSVGIGMALANRLKGVDARIFVVMGDGEINEGSVWEGCMCAAKHGLDRLTAIVDYNKIQSYGPTDEVQPLEPLLDKFAAFGFEVTEADGHDVTALDAAVAKAKTASGKPSAIVAHTVKGRGLGFAEHDPKWHHVNKVTPEMVADMTAALDAAS